MNLRNLFGGLKNRIIKLPLVFKIIIPCALLGAGYFGVSQIVSGQSAQNQYVTGTVEKGALMTTVSASGTITSGAITYVTTGATGTVSKVYVQNGDTVKKGQKIADIALDDTGLETQVTAWNNYQTALVNIKNAEKSRVTDNITVTQKKEAMEDAETAKRDAHSGGWNPQTRQPYTENELVIVDKQYDEAIAAYNAAITDDSTSDTNIALKKAEASAAYRNYQKVSSSIYAPATGVLQNLTLAVGVTVGTSSTSSITVSTGTNSSENSQSVTSVQIGAIKNPDGQYQATVSLTEVDVTTVKSTQKVTLTMDAYPDATLTGSVLAVNTSGSVSSGVTSYTATILLDNTTLDLYTNMAVSSTIITSSEENVLLVPTTAIQSDAEKSYVEVLKDGKVTQITVEIGNSNDSQTVIKSGLSEGDTIITSTISSSSTTKSSSTKSSSNSSTGTNVFSGSGGMGAGMTGGPGF
ncbi:MAG TPA: efflux RND transporter periplasmic adaptor subunit [Candidatus Woesebacteria bacterium]|nr:efflux RND transporter periplasmic adaptor subunit [Candidatus Woesebacteria bacterium]